MTRHMFLILILLSTPIHAQGAVILFLGDSLTAGYGVEAEESFVSIIKTKLRQTAPEVEVINGGVSGSTSASVLSRLKWYQQKHPSILFLALGANDGLRGLSTLELYRNLHKAVTYAKAQGMLVILAGMEVPPNYGEQYANEFREVYRKLSRNTGVTLMPFLLEDVAGLPVYNLSDGIHPNAEGHKRVAENVYPYIAKELKTYRSRSRLTTTQTKP